MPRPVPVTLRHEVILLHRQGRPLARVAADLALPYGTVRALWRR
jgi:hypothetical protein